MATISDVGQLYMGIDPGKAGGIAVVDAGGGLVDAVKMPERMLDLLALLQRYQSATALLEFVHAMPKQGVVSAFTFGQGLGRLEMGLTAAGVRYSEITPAQWQKLMECRTAGNKNVTKAVAVSRWPNVKVTHAIADAMLIAECCRILELRQRAATARGFK